MNYLLLLIPLLSLLLGWGLMRFAAWYIFSPARPVTILGIKVQGIFPAYQKELAKEAGIYAGKLLSGLDLEAKLADPAHFQQVKPVIEEHIDEFLRHKLKEQMPMISMFIGDKTIQSLKEIFIKEIENLFPRVLQQFAGNLQKNLAAGPLLESHIAGMDPSVIKKAFAQKAGGAMRKAALAGAVAGLLTGLVQLAIILIIK